MKYFEYLLFFSLAFSDYVIDESKSKVIYYGKHPLHSWSGMTSNIKLNSQCKINDDMNCDFEFQIPIMSFYSGNDNRDSNMLHYLNAFLFPNVKMTFENVIIMNYNGTLMNSQLHLNDIKRYYQIPINISSVSDKEYLVESIFFISLDDFDVEIPKLLFLPIDDQIMIEVKLLIFR
tara:strand:- start:167 stop:694 length:528 start_codon:yes stop_codon:yes gene_type:complete